MTDFGRFAGYRPPPDLDQAQIASGGLGWPVWFRRFRLKQWYHIGVVTRAGYGGVAVVDAAYTATAFGWWYSRASGRKLEADRQSPFAGRQVPAEETDSNGFFRLGAVAIDIRANAAGGEYRLKGGFPREGLAFDLKLRVDESRFQPITVCLPLGGGRYAYSHKGFMPVEGTIRAGAEEVVLDPSVDRGMLDVHRALYPYRMFWHWASFAGRSTDGHELAVNLTRNVVEDDSVDNECCIWIDGRPNFLSPVRFHLDPERIEHPWRIATLAGEADVLFHPLAMRHEDMNLGLARSKFHQPYGDFTGRLTVEGHTYQIENAAGVCEHHIARW